jgi:hypothetical protein
VESGLAETADDISFEGTEIKEYIRTGRGTEETMYAITLPAWDQLEDDKKKEVLQKALAFAKENRKRHVQLLNVKGWNVAFASDGKLELIGATP